MTLMVQRITGSCNGQEEDPQEEDQTSNIKTSIKASTFQEKEEEVFEEKKKRFYFFNIIKLIRLFFIFFFSINFLYYLQEKIT